jgi:uncharacterized protein YcbX
MLLSFEVFPDVMIQFRHHLRLSKHMHLSEINIYPIKSLKGIALESAVVEGRGLRFDRRWMLVEPDGKFMTQRDFPVMATIETSVAGDQLVVSKGGDELDVPFEPDSGDRLEVTIWGDSGLSAVAYNGAVSGWFSKAVGTPCKLVVMLADTNRMIERDFAVRPDDTVSFADAYPFLLLGEASVADLNTRLASPVPINRFRPNFVVAGSGAFDEDTWKRIRIGETEFHVVKPCARCVLTTVDQTSGIKDGKEPLATLASFRTRDGKVLFGQNLIAESVGSVVRVGDEIEVIERKV